MSDTYSARIYQPAKSAMQSGRGKVGVWLLEYERPAAGRPDAVMGWDRMPDTVTQVKLTFGSREEAVAYAQAKRLEYSVSEPHAASVPPKSYAENFSTAKRRAWDANC